MAIGSVGAGVTARQTAEITGFRSPWQQALRRFAQHRLALVSAIILLVFVLAAIFAPIVAGQSPYAIDLSAINSPPSRQHLLGTDAFGRDVWARLVYATRVSLSVGIVAVGIYTAIGILLGTAAGYYGGLVDGIIMRCTDTVMSFPSIMLIIIAVSLIGPSIYNIMIVIGLLGWTGTARLVRGEFLALRNRDFIVAAQMIGVPDWQVIFKHMLPNAIAPVVVASTLGVAGAIFTETGLSFLGLGVQVPTASWGNMLTEAQHLHVLQLYPWEWISPGLAIAIAVLAINFVGDGLRDALDPRIRLH